MNIAMEQTEEYVNGQLKNKYGDCFIRGNNGAPGSRSRQHCAWFCGRCSCAPSACLASTARWHRSSCDVAETRRPTTSLLLAVLYISTVRHH